MALSPLLIFGRMPENAAPRTHLPAGPWCFAGQEDRFPGWEKRFSFPAETLRGAEDLERVTRRAWALVIRCLPLIAERLDRERGARLPEAFWETALTPSLLIAAQILAERRERIRALIGQWGSLPLRVPLLPDDCVFTFENDHDLSKRGFCGFDYNHWIFSLLLRPNLPPDWEPVLLPRVCRNFASEARGFGGLLRRALRRIAYAPPFPHVKGFTPLQALRFSLALLQNGNRDDRSISLAEFARRYAVPPAAPEDLPFDPLPLFWSALPRVLMRAQLPRRIRAARRKRVYIASVASLEDTAYRLRLAARRGAGHKLVCIQHGGNYGMLRCAATTPLEEYNQHAFIAWGRCGHAPHGNFIALPHAQPSGLRDAHRGGADDLLFVGNGMELFPHRLDSRPNPTQILEYRRAKGRFLAALPAEIQNRTRYRPYFDVPASLEDWPWISARFPAVSRCSGPLDAAMLACRLMVLDHHGTTLLLALAADTPLLLYWDARAWDLCPEAEASLALLHEAGVWHPTPEQAAAALLRIWPDVRAYWRSAPVRKARAHWCERYALSAGGDFAARWIRALKTV